MFEKIAARVQKILAGSSLGVDMIRQGNFGLIFLGVGALWLPAFLTPPKTTILLSTFLFIQTWGPLVTAGILLLGLLAEYWSNRTLDSNRTLSSVSNFAIFLGCIEMLLWSFGDEMFRLASAEPDKAMGVALGIVILTISWIVVRPRPVYEGMFRSAGPLPVMYAAAIISRQMTPLDERITAVHEAGHALLLAEIYDSLPDFSASILPQGSSLGRLLYRPSDNTCLLSKYQLQWNMMMKLAGTAAEQVLLKEDYSGSHTDLVGWDGFARQYCAMDTSEPFFYIPRNSYEAEVNARTMAKLREQQMETIRTALNINRDILDELAQELQREKELGRERLFEYLKRVRPYKKV